MGRLGASSTSSPLPGPAPLPPPARLPFPQASAPAPSPAAPSAEPPSHHQTLPLRLSCTWCSQSPRAPLRLPELLSCLVLLPLTSGGGSGRGAGGGAPGQPPDLTCPQPTRAPAGGILPSTDTELLRVGDTGLPQACPSPPGPASLDPLKASTPRPAHLSPVRPLSRWSCALDSVPLEDLSWPL